MVYSLMNPIMLFLNLCPDWRALILFIGFNKPHVYRMLSVGGVEV